jgi:UDPglucose 6-dehydrogenase
VTEGAAAREPLGVIGVGWVGLVTAVCFADLGHEVWCVDVNREKVESLSRGQVTLHEPGIAEAVQRNLERLHFGTDSAELFANARLAFVCVDTPPTASGDADLSRVHSVFDALPPAAAGALLVMKSTVPVGTGRTLRFELDRRGLEGIGYASNPEFLREGSAIADFRQPDRVVVGAEDEEARQRLVRLYEPITDEIVSTDLASAELIKLASNAFLATKISFINEIANVCEEVDADVAEVARGMGLDSRIGGSFLRPGIGYGGSCFPKDVSALKQLAGNSGYHFQLLASVIEVNELQKRRVIGKLKRHLGELRGRRIALWGLAFKPDTNDMREASSIVLAHRLNAVGAVVSAYDPVVTAAQLAGELPEVEIAATALEAADGADGVVIVTEWPEFREPVLDGTLRSRMASPLIVDGRNMLDPEAVRAAGYVYEGVGRGAAVVASET